MKQVNNMLRNIITEKYVVRSILQMKKEMEWVELINSYNGCWGSISSHKFLSHEFIRAYQDSVDWTAIATNQKLSIKFMEEFEHKMNWVFISQNINIREDFIIQHQDKIVWRYITGCIKKLDFQFIETHAEKFDWKYISTIYQLSDAFIRKFRDNIYWAQLCRYHTFTQEFAIEQKDYINYFELHDNKNHKNFSRAFILYIKYNAALEYTDYSDTEEDYL